MQKKCEVRDKPRSHIYIAGSMTAAFNRYANRKPQWKIGHAYCLVDRFYTAPHSYLETHKGHGFWPVMVWGWVGDGAAVECHLKKVLPTKPGIKPAHVEDFKTETFNAELETLASAISAEIKGLSTDALAVQSYNWSERGADFLNLRQCLLQVGSGRDFEAAIRLIRELKSWKGNLEAEVADAK